MISDFNDLKISPPILKALQDMGFESPTEVQCRAIPHILNREDVIVISKTGSGKTAVFGVPILQMTDPEAQGPQALILTPTRELAVQVDSDIKRMAKHLRHRTTSVYGQHSMDVEVQTLNDGITIVTGTPGRVFDHISHRHLKTKHIRFLVLDEADRMLDMGFFHQVVRIVRTLPRNRMTLLFSATVPPEVRKLCLDYMKNPVTVEIESPTRTVETTQQVYYRVSENKKNTFLNQLLLFERPESCVIFCNKRNTVDKLQNFLDRRGYASRALHGDIPQNKRLKTIQQFKRGDFPLLVATDVAARGLHIENLSLVINYDLPLEKDGYIHRIGRTGRAGNAGRAVTLVAEDDIMTLYEIEEHIGTLIPQAELPAEEILDEQRPDIEKWLQANAKKRKMMGGVPASNSKGQEKHPQPQASNHQGKQREQSRNRRRKRNHKPAEPIYAATRNEQAKPATAAVPRQEQAGPTQASPVNVEANPANASNLSRQPKSTGASSINRQEKPASSAASKRRPKTDNASSRTQGARAVTANPVPGSEPFHHAKPNAIQSKINQDSKKNQATSKQQPLIQRLFNLIWGRRKEA